MLAWQDTAVDKFVAMPQSHEVFLGHFCPQQPNAEKNRPKGNTVINDASQRNYGWKNRFWDQASKHLGCI